MCRVAPGATSCFCCVVASLRGCVGCRSGEDEIGGQAEVAIGASFIGCNQKIVIIRNMQSYGDAGQEMMEGRWLMIDGRWVMGEGRWSLGGWKRRRTKRFWRTLGAARHSERLGLGLARAHGLFSKGQRRNARCKDSPTDHSHSHKLSLPPSTVGTVAIQF